MPPPSLVLQTTYAELMERCAAASFMASFPQDGGFVAKTVKGRKYWYFQSGANGSRSQKYVGRETPELLEQIGHHKDAREDERERRGLVSTLVRSFGLPRPIPQMGEILAAMERAGVFRLRAVLVGTVAYQTYSAMLGAKLSAPMLMTGDIDIAQFGDVSVAINDRIPPILSILNSVDTTFRAVPTIHKDRVTSYTATGGLRVDFLVPNTGPDSDKPRPLPALQTDAQPLRFLDFLIRDPEPATILHGPGIYVNVPSPQRYAIHKLIVARRRSEGSAKRDKDLHQAETLLALLCEKRPHELKSAWKEAYKRGPKWRELLKEGLGQLALPIRDAVCELTDTSSPRAK